MIVVWLDDAEIDLDRETDYLMEHNPQAALRIALAIRAQVANLAHYPEIGRIGRVVGTRELVIMDTPYIVPYYLKGREVRILAVIHAKRKWPESFNLQ
jgi:plasmid stabilization system protein ParE